jgi:hypothetical protein
MMLAYGTAIVSAPGAAYGLFFGVRLVTRVFHRVAPLVRFADGYAKEVGVRAAVVVD